MTAKDDFNDMDELLQTFTSEGQELLDEVEPRLIELQEKTGADGQIDGEVLNSIFRIFHTIKGSAGFLELNNLQEVTHEAETLLDYYRKGNLTPNPEQISLLLQTTDFIRKLLGNIEKFMHDKGFEIETKRMVETLNAVKSGKSAASVVKTAPVEKMSVTPQAAAVIEPQVADDLGFTISADMVEQYTREALDIIDGLEQNILEMEKTPGNTELVDNAFRALHTLKGNSGLLGYAELERLSHKTENLFDHMRNGAILPDMENIKMVLSIIDLIRATVVGISNGESGAVKGCDVLVGFIEDVINESLARAEEDADDEEQPPVPEPVAAPEAEPPAVTVEPAREEIFAAEPVKDEPTRIEQTVKTAPKQSETAARKEESSSDKMASRKDIRVDLDKVDKLVDLVGELSLAEMMVVQNPAVIGIEAEDFERATHHLDRVIAELQYVSMSLRMVPIAATFRKLIRLVHDLSYKSGKIVRLETLGEDTEVDKTVAEQIADPLVHIVRNAIDHGIEMPDDRKADGKTESGTLTIAAKHEGGEVWIEISDDGRGLNREKILKKAKNMGMVSGDGAELKDEEVFKLILEPGFSTAEKITEVSGRGVGMDVVKKNLEKINGHVDIATMPGKWSRFTLRIPLTLALMDGMLVQVGATRYIVPLLSIRECIRPLAKDITVTPDGQELVKVRDELIPVIRLHMLHNIRPEHTELIDLLLIVVEHRGRSFCMTVDGVLGQQQAVIKGLSDYVGDVRGVSGCTILGDGTVSLILDIGSLVEMISEDAVDRSATVG